MNVSGRILVSAYGTPIFLDRVWNMPERTENIEEPMCFGVVIILIFNLAGSCALIRRAKAADWFFPMGRIHAGEGIIDAARREAMEEVGVVIEPLGVPLCQMVTLTFSNLTLQRWHIVVVAETASSVLDPLDHVEIEEARLFDVLPPVNDTAIMSWMKELYSAGTRYMRSLDAMDGI